METALVIIALISVLIFVNGLYVAAEFSTIHAQPTRLAQYRASESLAAKFLKTIISNPHRLDTYIAASQIGVTISSLVLGFYGQWVVVHYLHPTLTAAGWNHILGIYVLVTIGLLVLLTLLQMVIGELLPKSLALRYVEGVALFSVPLMRWSLALFRPAIAVCNGIAAFLLGIVGITPATRRHILSPEEIEQLAMESVRWGLIEADERQLLHNVLRVGELTAARMMVPRTRMVAASVETSLHDLLVLATDSGRSRIPLYTDTIDTVVGSIHIKDLFRLHTENNTYVQDVLRSVSYVHENMPVLAVWNQLKQEGNYIAVVLDEFGGTAGMITVSDLLEEMFGELQDEFDTCNTFMSLGRDGWLRLQGESRIVDVNERFGLKLPDEEVNTLGGLTMAILGRLPQVGDEVVLEDVTLRVEAVNGPTVIEVSLNFSTTDNTPLVQDADGEDT
jgi:CBS domain containing-hemolysin-like protein